MSSKHFTAANFFFTVHQVGTTYSVIDSDGKTHEKGLAFEEAVEFANWYNQPYIINGN